MSAALIGEAQGNRARPLIMRSQRIAEQAVGLGILASLLASQTGCTSGPMTWSAPSFAQIFAAREPLRNPLTVPSPDFEKVWNKSVIVVSKYFPIASENRLAGTIRTESPDDGNDHRAVEFGLGNLLWIASRPPCKRIASLPWSTSSRHRRGAIWSESK